jgi:hypothetical protein
METMRDSWTDERMDDLSHRMDQGFDRVDADIRELRADMDRGFDRVDSDLGGLRAEMNLRFDALQRTLFLGATGVVAALIGLIATQL